MEIHSTAVSGATLHSVCSRWVHMKAWGEDGIAKILAAVEHSDPYTVIDMYRDIEAKLHGDYECWGEFTSDYIVCIRFKVKGEEFLFYDVDDWYARRECLPNYKRRPTMEDEIQEQLGHFGLGTSFPDLMAAWKRGEDDLQFTEFTEALPKFLRGVLVSVAKSHPTINSPDDLGEVESEAGLLKLAIQGHLSDEDAAATGWYADEAFAYLSGDLEELHEFEQLGRLLERGSDGYLDEDGEVIRLVEAIFVGEFIDPLYRFVLGLIDTRLRIGGAWR